jgi:hypothetical protein
VIISTPTINTSGAGRPQRSQPTGHITESELSKLIRYGCQFELEVHQMAELSQMRAENIKLRRKADKA